MELTDYARIAPYYDTVYGDYHDIGFYRNVARQFGEPVLEVAVQEWLAGPQSPPRRHDVPRNVISDEQSAVE